MFKMSAQGGSPGPGSDSWDGANPLLCEEDIHQEHRAALEATLFEQSTADDEVIFELTDGELRLRALRR